MDVREPRRFPGQRWFNIGLRSAHLVGIAGLGGGYLFALEDARWLPFGYLALASGIALALLYLWSSPLWLTRLGGQVVVLKCLLLAVAMAVPAWRAELFVSVIVLSGVVAHAPGRVREWCWWRETPPGQSR